MRPRNFSDMYTKWSTKFDPDIVSARFEAVKDIAVTRYEQAQAVIATVQSTVKEVLTDLGVPPAQWGMYIALAEQLAKYSFKHSGATLQRIAAGLKARFVTGNGADPAVADAVIKAVLGTLPSY